MAFSLIPKEVKFFDLFDVQMAHVVKAAEFFKELVSKGTYNEASIQNMRDIEHECDSIAHDIIDKLNRTFITPFDREDIHSLANEIDNVVDMLYAITKKLKVYKVKGVDKNLIEFGNIIEESVKQLLVAITGLRTHKKSKPINEACIEVNRLENVADHLKDSIFEKLFNKPKDPIKVMIWKEIYEAAETVLDVCEDVANLVITILVKQG